MKMRLLELYDNDKETKKVRSKKLLKSWKDIEEVFYYQGFLSVSIIIYFKLIKKYYNNSLAGYFEIKKT